MMADRSSRADEIIAEARAWIGTPYAHQASCKAAGADCLGLVRGVWRAVYGREPEAPPEYGADWADFSGEERLLAAARRHLIEVPRAEAEPGDLLLFRMRKGAVAKHVALLVAPHRMVHAYSGHAVLEAPFSEAWARRLAAVFRFPEGV